MLSIGACGSVPEDAKIGKPVSLWNGNTTADDTSGPDPTGKFKIALLAPLSGPHARLGMQLRDAATLALFDRGDEAIELLPRDTKGTPEGAAVAAERAIAEGAQLILGPLFSQSVVAIKPILAAANIQAIAFSNNRAVAGGSIFLIGNHPEVQLTALSAYLNQTDRRRVALIGPDTHYLRIIRDRLVQTDKAGQIKLVDVRLYRDSDDYTTISKHVEALTKYKQRARALQKFIKPVKQAYATYDDPEKAKTVAMKKLSQLAVKAVIRKASFQQERRSGQPWGPTESDYGSAISALQAIYDQKLRTSKTPHQAMADALTEFEHRETLGPIEIDTILVPVGGETLLVLAPMFEYFNATLPEVRLFGTGIWDSGKIGRKRDLVGSQYVTPLSPAWPTFRTRFGDVFGYGPGELAATAYDAITVAATARNELEFGLLDATFLTREQGFTGINGPFRFLADGSNEKRLYIVELSADGRQHLTAWSPPVTAAPATALGDDAERKIAPILPAASPATNPARPETPVS